MISSTEDIKKFINDNSFRKIFVLCGKKSFVTSGAEIFFKKLLSTKETKLFYKESYHLHLYHSPYLQRINYKHHYFLY